MMVSSEECTPDLIRCAEMLIPPVPPPRMRYLQCFEKAKRASCVSFMLRYEYK